MEIRLSRQIDAVHPRGVLRRLVHRAPGQLSPQPLHNMLRNRHEVGQKSGPIRRYRAANSRGVRKLMTGPDEGRCQEKEDGHVAPPSPP